MKSFNFFMALLVLTWMGPHVVIAETSSEQEYKLFESDGGGGADWGDDLFQSSLRSSADYLFRYFRDLSRDQVGSLYILENNDSVTGFENLRERIVGEILRLKFDIHDRHCENLNNTTHSWICTTDQPMAYINVSPEKFLLYNQAIAGSKSAQASPNISRSAGATSSGETK